MKYFFKMILLFLLATSCLNRENLTTDEKNFNPYSIGDQLIFESNSHEIDTFLISEINQLYNDAPVFLKEYRQSLRVLEGISPPGEIFDTRRLLLQLNSGGSEKPTFVEFFDFEGDKILLHEIPNLEKITLTTPFGTYSDVIHLINEPKERSKHKNFQLFWSVKVGLLKFESGDSTIWTLVNKI